MTDKTVVGSSNPCNSDLDLAWRTFLMNSASDRDPWEAFVAAWHARGALIGNRPTGNETFPQLPQPECVLPVAKRGVGYEVVICYHSEASAQALYRTMFDRLPTTLRPELKAFVHLCALHGKDWLTCPECAKAAVSPR